MGVGASMVFVYGSNEYECGRAWLHTTMAYLSGNEPAEIATAMLACVFAGGSSLTIVMLRAFVDCNYHAVTPLVHKDSSLFPWWAVVLIWILVTVVFSAPSFLYALSHSIPGGDANTLHIPAQVLAASRYGIGAILAFINAVAVPSCARRIAKEPQRAIPLILFARLTVTLVVPFIVLFVFGQDCHAKWLLLWDPCTNSTHFEVYDHTKSKY
jgi:hypothetical protein